MLIGYKEMKVGDYLVCKKEHRRGDNIIFKGKKYKIVSIVKGLSITRVCISSDFIYPKTTKCYSKQDLADIGIDIGIKDGLPCHSIEENKGQLVFALKDSDYNIKDYFLEVSEVREEKLKELGI